MALLVTTLLGFAIIPSFHADDSAWQATHIVIVDGEMKVIESLAGNLEPGARLDLPQLGRLGREIHYWGPRKQDDPTHVSGDRVLLFLRKTATGWQGATSYQGGLRICAVWLEVKKSYAYSQVINPGPLVLAETLQDEKALRAQIALVRRARTELATIAKLDDAAERTRRASTFLMQQSWSAHHRALEIIEACGPAAAPTLRAMLADPMWGKQHETVIGLMGKTGGEGVGADLTALLARDVAFWKKTGPKLKKGWWNEQGSTGLRNRYGITHQTLRALHALRYRPSAPTVTELRNFWRSLPQLHDKRGLDQITRACDATLSALRK